MDNHKSKILIIVEGEKTDYHLMTHLLDMYGISQNHEIVSYHTNIYVLYNEMFRDQDPASKDTLQCLKAHEKNPEYRRLLNQRYSDILLIFDLDPQDAQFSFEKISEMVHYFNESSDMGKLYLNYPMVEAFYHMKSIPDPQYATYTADMKELREHTYKKRVNKENRNHEYKKFAVNREEYNLVIKQNIDKANRIAQRSEMMNINEYRIPQSADILAAQLRKLANEDKLYDLCTCVFYIPDYNPMLLIS